MLRKVQGCGEEYRDMGKKVQRYGEKGTEIWGRVQGYGEEYRDMGKSTSE